MNYLLDACVLREMQHPQGSVRVKETVERFPVQSLYLSVITAGEMQQGIFLMPSSPKKEQLERWFEDILYAFDRRVLEVDLESALIWGEISAKGRKNGRVLPTMDGLIAATAIRHGLHVMTRNTKDFEKTGAMLFNPWEG